MHQEVSHHTGITLVLVSQIYMEMDEYMSK